jgi:hypothetical protein
MTCTFVLVRLRAWQALLLGVLRICSDTDHLRPFLHIGGLGAAWVVSRGDGSVRGSGSPRIIALDAARTAYDDLPTSGGPHQPRHRGSGQQWAVRRCTGTNHGVRSTSAVCHAHGVSCVNMFRAWWWSTGLRGRPDEPLTNGGPGRSQPREMPGVIPEACQAGEGVELSGRPGTRPSRLATIDPVHGQRQHWRSGGDDDLHSGCGEGGL